MTLPLITISTTGRWVLNPPRARYERGVSCAYCGTRYDNGACVPVACLLCGTVQCSGNGLGSGCCKVCTHGYLPGWGRSAAESRCGYSGCAPAPAVAWVTRRKPACAVHAAPRLGAMVAEEIAWRDAGGTPHLRWQWLDLGVLIGNRV